ncbi:hypothetical protein ACF1CG_00160 [Streptomyces sp. NPDC014773]|uniref:hypothetical protein n=1 Tax=Streptomyces sp. NPDC014773 TaxID=3364908 RepID=UPI003701505F
MTGLRGTTAAAAVLSAATALSGALVLLSGFVYQLVDGGPTGALIAWALGLLVLAVALFAAFGSLLPALDAAPDPDPDADAAPGSLPTSDSAPAPDSLPFPGSPPAPVPYLDPATAAAALPAAVPGSAAVPVPAAAAGPAVKPPAEAEKWFDGWFDVLSFCCVLVGLLAGGPLGIAGYEALRPDTVATAPDPLR